MSKISDERIAKLPEPIQKHVYPEDPYWCYVPEGWRDLVCKMNEHLEALEPYYILHQVKEKFGGLRYYTHTPDRTNNEHDLFSGSSFRTTSHCRFACVMFVENTVQNGLRVAS